LIKTDNTERLGFGRLNIPTTTIIVLLFKNMQPFERDSQVKNWVSYKTWGKLQLRCSKCWLKENCGPKSVVVKISIFSPCSLRASPRRKLTLIGFF